jgi:hypothetical protein
MWYILNSEEDTDTRLLLGCKVSGYLKTGAIEKAQVGIYRKANKSYTRNIRSYIDGGALGDTKRRRMAPHYNIPRQEHSTTSTDDRSLPCAACTLGRMPTRNQA